MSAHLRDIRALNCKHCASVARVELFNTFNAPLGSFCRTHGLAALAEIRKREQADWNAGIRNNGRVEPRESP